MSVRTGSSQGSAPHAGASSAPIPERQGAGGEQPGSAPWRLELFARAGTEDVEGRHLLTAARELGLAGLVGARLGRGYLLPPGLTRAQVDHIARELLVDPVQDQLRLYTPGEDPAPPVGARRVLVARKPGVMDTVAATIERALSRAGLLPVDGPRHVSTFRAWEFSGSLSDADLGELARRLLGNETIEDVRIGDERLPYGPPPPGPVHGRIVVPLLDADDARLAALSAEGALSLDHFEMRAIQAHYRELGRERSACELETLAQTWSEHCKHKTFAGPVDFEGERIDNLLSATIKRATRELDRDWCVSVFHDNAGIIAFAAGDEAEPEGWDLAFKVETHNHPSAIDPYGGAGTGVGGVIRDILGVGLGARPIANTDCFFVGPLDLPREDVPKGSMHPARILRGMVAGVRDYGNRMGIPTVSGGVWVHPAYVGNPLVYCGTVGLIPRRFANKRVEPGDLILVVGGRTGRDGIHGATFSSLELSEESERVSSAAVQIGDPITEKRVLDGLLRARDAGLYRALTDCGAGGLSSAVGEMGQHTGAEVALESVPLKYPGLAPEEIWISEAQERMVLAVPPGDLDACQAIFDAEDVETAVIGRFTDTGVLRLTWHGEVVGELGMEFLHEGTPKRVRQATWSAPALADPACPPCADPEATLLALLGDPSIASKEWIVRQYDHEVQGMSVLKPLVGPGGDGPGDGAVLQPLPNSRRGAAITCGAQPFLGELDPYRMALASIDEALRNAVAVGGDPERTAILDNFSWGNCEKPDRLGALVLAARACLDGALAYGTPFISGKDSLNNEYRVGERTLAIPPTLLISALAIVPDVGKSVSMDLKQPGNLVYLVGRTRPELGGSRYLALLGLEGGTVPAPDLAEAPRILRDLHAAMAAGLVRSCHDLSEGGLAVAAAECAFAGRNGLELDLAAVPCAPLPTGYDGLATRLFAESCTRFLVEVETGRREAFERALAGVPCALVGRVVSEPHLRINDDAGSALISLPLEELRRAHQGAFQG
jgi:phosphoribosylformylglycinamidine synthase subunit PurSL